MRTMYLFCTYDQFIMILHSCSCSVYSMYASGYCCWCSCIYFLLSCNITLQLTAVLSARWLNSIFIQALRVCVCVFVVDFITVHPKNTFFLFLFEQLDCQCVYICGNIWNLCVFMWMLYSLWFSHNTQQLLTLLLFLWCTDGIFCISQWRYGYNGRTKTNP